MVSVVLGDLRMWIVGFGRVVVVVGGETGSEVGTFV